MGKSAPSPPPPPDPVATANAQAAANKESAIASQEMSMVNQVTPYGSLTYSQRGTSKEGNPLYTATQRLSPAQQRLLNTQQDANLQMAQLGRESMGRVRETMGGPLDLSAAPARVNSISTAGLPGIQSRAGTMGFQTFVPQASVSGQIADVGGVQREIGADDFGDDRQRVENALMQRMSPTLDRRREGLETQLVNQGFQRGTQAFDRQMDEFYRSENDARLAAIGQAGQEQARLFGMDATRGQFANQAQQQAFGQAAARGQFENQATLANNATAMGQADFRNQAIAMENQRRQQEASFMNAARAQGLNERQAQAAFQNASRSAAIQEIMLERQTPINEVSALLSGGQVVAPTFTATPGASVNPADIMGATYQSANMAQQNYAQQMAARNSNMQGIYGLMGAGLGFAGATFNPMAGAAMPGGGTQGGWNFSDRRLKRDIVRLGELANGLPFYAYRYLWSPVAQIGLMADEVKALKPWAVKSFGGFDAVNYAEAVR